MRSSRKADNKKTSTAIKYGLLWCKAGDRKKVVSEGKADEYSTSEQPCRAALFCEKWSGGLIFYSIKNRNKRNSFRRGTPDAIRDAPVRSPRKADNKKQAPQSNTVDCGAVFWHA